MIRAKWTTYIHEEDLDNMPQHEPGWYWLATTKGVCLGRYVGPFKLISTTGFVFAHGGRVLPERLKFFAPVEFPEPP